MPVNILPPASRCHTLFIRKDCGGHGGIIKDKGRVYQNNRVTLLALSITLRRLGLLRQTLLIRKYLLSASPRAQPWQAGSRGYRTPPCPHPCPRRCSQTEGGGAQRRAAPRQKRGLLRRHPPRLLPSPLGQAGSGGCGAPGGPPGRTGRRSPAGCPAPAEGSGVGERSVRS